jgi:hypothetical protein
LFDFGLHFRFLQKATEAFFEMGQASVAASLAWQSRVHDELTTEGGRATSGVAGWPAAFGNWLPEPAPVAANPVLAWSAAAQQFSPWQMWLAACAPAASRTPEWSSYPTASWQFVTGAWQNLASPNAAAGALAAASGWQAVASASTMWGATPWAFYQGPLTAMMLSFGVPYSVAAPTARASTSAMDAAEAAYTQWRRIFASTNESADWRPPNLPWSTYLH